MILKGMRRARTGQGVLGTARTLGTTGLDHIARYLRDGRRHRAPESRMLEPVRAGILAGASAPAVHPPAVHPIVIRFGRVGDMVLLSALLHLLHRRYRMPCLLIGSGPWSAEIYAGHPDIARVWSMAGRHIPLLLGLTWWRMLRMLLQNGTSPVYVCETETSPQARRVKLLLALAGVAQGRCLYLPPQTPGAGEHCVDRLLRFAKQTPPALRSADYPCPSVDPCPRLQVQDGDRIERNAWIKTHGCSARPIVLVQPGNRRSMRGRWRLDTSDHKAWPLANWAALLQLVHASLPQAQIVLCGSRQELGMLRQVRLASGLDAVAAVHLPLRTLLALCEVAHSMISIDSGPAHLAAAMGAPLVVLFGNTPAREWSPRGPGAPVIALGGAPGVCHVNQVPVQTVFEAWRSLLSTKV
jgi:heptosyltransferase-2/heptosyltransferase-3